MLFSRREAADVRLPYRDISKDGVEFRQETVTAIDPLNLRATTEVGSYDADFLVVAPGANTIGGYAGVPGGRVRVLLARRSRAPAGGPGRVCERDGVVIGVLYLPFKRPPAPLRAPSCCTTSSCSAA